MKDLESRTEHDSYRYEAERGRGEFERDYDAADEGPLHAQRHAIPDNIRAAVAAAYDSIKVECETCGGKLWSQADLAAHQRKRHGG